MYEMRCAIRNGNENTPRKRLKRRSKKRAAKRQERIIINLRMLQRGPLEVLNAKGFVGSYGRSNLQNRSVLLVRCFGKNLTHHFVGKSAAVVTEIRARKKGEVVPLRKVEEK
jgi:hypothetical protein